MDKLINSYSFINTSLSSQFDRTGKISFQPGGLFFIFFSLIQLTIQIFHTHQQFLVSWNPSINYDKIQREKKGQDTERKDVTGRGRRGKKVDVVSSILNILPLPQKSFFRGSL